MTWKLKQKCIGRRTTQSRDQCNNRRGKAPFLKMFDSPVIYGVRVETSNPYHLLYIDRIKFYNISLTAKASKVKKKTG